MKKILLLALMCCFISITHAQTIAPTTDEEYTMGLVGYKMFLQMGVEIKQGYKVNPLAEYEYAERKASFKGLFRPGEQKPCAIIMIYTRLRGAPEYYCIPTLDAPEFFWDRFRTSLAGETDNQQEQLQFFCFSLAKALSLYTGK